MSCIWTFSSYIKQQTGKSTHRLTAPVSHFVMGKRRPAGVPSLCGSSPLSSPFVRPAILTSLFQWNTPFSNETKRYRINHSISSSYPWPKEYLYIFTSLRRTIQDGQGSWTCQTRILHWGDQWNYHYIGITESLTVCFATLVPIDTRKSIENLINKYHNHRVRFLCRVLLKLLKDCVE